MISSNHSEVNGDVANKGHRRSSEKVCLAIIHWIQSLRSPRCLRRSGDEKGTPFLTGLDRVIYGTQPAAEVVQVFGVYPPRYLCYMISGSGCDIIQFGIDILLHEVMNLQDASVCWALGFGISVIFRHTTHRYLVSYNHR
jgi:hypothetical protein